MDYADFSSLAQRCAPTVAVETLWAIAQAESRADPYAIGINGDTRLLRHAKSPREAAGWSRWLVEHGHNIDMGLMQINAKNLPGFGLTFETVFDPCANIAAAGRLLGAARTFAGHGSDGLVRIENATLSGLKADGTPGQPCAKAFAYRAHSGYFGIVNSEEAYQNLTRFLFGDVRVDIWIDLEEIRLPSAVQAAVDGGSKINALYQFEALASPRGKLWYLTRRVAEEDSVACLSDEEWRKAPKKNGQQYLSTVFLANRARVNKSRPSLAYSLALGVRVPDYEIDRKLWVNEHYEGGYLFRNTIIVEMVPPQQPGDKWQVNYAWQDHGMKAADSPIDPKRLKDGKIDIRIPLESATTPGITGTLRFVVSSWNPDAVMRE